MSTPPLASDLAPTTAAVPPALPEDTLVAVQNFGSAAPRRFFDGASDRAALAILRERFPEYYEAVAQAPTTSA